MAESVIPIAIGTAESSLEVSIDMMSEGGFVGVLLLMAHGTSRHDL